MEIFGIGTSEILFVIVLALIILGPKDMQKAGKTIGRWLRNLITSDGWKVFQQTSRELRTLPNRLMREANEELGDIGRELKNTSDHINHKTSKAGGSDVDYKPMPINPPSLPSLGKIELSIKAEPESKAEESDPKVDA